MMEMLPLATAVLLIAQSNDSINATMEPELLNPPAFIKEYSLLSLSNVSQGASD